MPLGLVFASQKVETVQRLVFASQKVETVQRLVFASQKVETGKVETVQRPTMLKSQVVEILKSLLSMKLKMNFAGACAVGLPLHSYE